MEKVLERKDKKERYLKRSGVIIGRGWCVVLNGVTKESLAEEVMQEKDLKEAREGTAQRPERSVYQAKGRTYQRAVRRPWQLNLRASNVSAAILCSVNAGSTGNKHSLVQFARVTTAQWPGSPQQQEFISL